MCKKSPPAVFSPSVMFAQSYHVAVLSGLYSHYGDSTWFVLNVESHWLVMVSLASVQLLETHWVRSVTTVWLQGSEAKLSTNLCMQLYLEHSYKEKKSNKLMRVSLIQFADIPTFPLIRTVISHSVANCSNTYNYSLLSSCKILTFK